MTDLSNTPRVELKIEYLPLSDIRPDPSNPRLHGKRHVRQIAKSIEAFGFNAPILTDDEKQTIIKNVLEDSTRIRRAHLGCLVALPGSASEHPSLENQSQAMNL